MILQIVNDLNNAGDLLAKIIVQDYFGIKVTCVFKNIPEKYEDRPILGGLGSFLGYYGEIALHVWGTGYEPGYVDSYHRKNPGSRNRWTFYAVRGPLTRRYFNLQDSLPLGDPAILTPLFYTPQSLTFEKVRYITHYDNENIDEINDIYPILSPKMHPYRFIDYITSSNFVFTESLHGAILAHVYGIPWAWALNRHTRATFKWHDWLASIGASADGVFSPTDIESAKSWYLRQKFKSLSTSRLEDAFPGANVLSIE